jgi:hypothetical protein
MSIVSTNKTIPPFPILKQGKSYCLLIGDIIDPQTHATYFPSLGFNPEDGKMYKPIGSYGPTNTNPMQYEFTGRKRFFNTKPLANKYIHTVVTVPTPTHIHNRLISRIYQCCVYYNKYWVPMETNKKPLKKRAVQKSIEANANTTLCLGIYHLPVDAGWDGVQLYPYLAIYIPTRQSVLFARADYNAKNITPTDPQIVMPVMVESIQALKDYSKATLDDENYTDLRRLIMELTFKGPAHKQKIEPFINDTLVS